MEKKTPKAQVSLLNESVELAQLNQPDSTLQISHSVVVAKQVEFRQKIWLRPLVPLLFRDTRTVIAQYIACLRQCAVIGRDHPAFSGGDGFSRMERKRGSDTKAAG